VLSPAAARATPRGLPAPPDRAAARLFLVGFPGTGPSPQVLGRLRLRDWGGVVLERGNGASTAQLAAMVDRVRAAAAAHRHQAPLVAARQPGGRDGAVPRVPPLESTVPDAATARRQAEAAGRGLRRLGVRLVLAPVADVARAGGPWERIGFADDVATTARLSAAAVAGWQAARVAAAPGHFPGEGAASGDPSLGPATVGLSLGELRAGDVKPFAAVARDAAAVQMSSALYAAWDGVTPATLLPEAVGLLRRDLRFDGVVVSGDLAAAALATGDPIGDVAVQALRAGCDLLWIPGDAADQEAAWRAVVRALRDHRVSAARVGEALRRVSVLRARYGVR
jgi:beta-N-acetylhexosaminidase